MIAKKLIPLKSILSLTFFCLLGFLCSGTNARAQVKPAPEYHVKAAFLYNFTRFVSWPSDAPPSDSPFVIGIVGNDPFGTYIDELVKGEAINSKPIVIRRYKSPNEIHDCNILFITSDKTDQMEKLLPELGHRGILTVGDHPSFVKSGGIIAFFKEDNKIRLQINVNEADAAKLKISSKLLAVSKIYRSKK